jgi:aromatic-L-amino-acid decarboxylase
MNAMEPDELRTAGAHVLDWIARYLEGIEALPVQTSVAPGWVRAQLPAHPPEEPDDWDVILADLDRVVVPAMTNWQSPSWFAFFPANSSPPSVLGDLVASGLGVQGMLWATGPACTELEQHVLDWLLELLGLPFDRFSSFGAGGGVIQHSGSDANLCAVLAARDRARDRADGDLRRLVAYTSVHAHSSVEKGLRIAGLAAEQLRLVDADERHALRADRMAELVAADIEAGRVPFLAVATVGTTSSLAIDPVADIAEVCATNGMWLHVDAAMAGSAAIIPALRPLLLDGIERVDSWCFDPHKWLFTNFDCTVLYVADRSALIESLSVLPEYLRNEASASGAVVDFRDWHVPLGRRFRALKLWFVLRRFGAADLRRRIAEHIELGQWLAARVDASDRYERLAPTDLNLVCLADRAGDDATERARRAVNESGRAYLTHTRLDGRLAIRVSIGQARTERRHV